MLFSDNFKNTSAQNTRMKFSFTCPTCKKEQLVQAPIGEAPTPPLCATCKQMMQRIWSTWFNLGPRATQDPHTRFQLKHL